MLSRRLSVLKHSSGETWVWLILGIGLALFSLVPIWSVEFPPLQDYPYHLLRDHILVNYNNPEYHYDALFVRTLFPIPYILFDYAMMFLGILLPIPVAGKLILSLYILMLPLSSFYFIRSVDKSKTWLGFFSFLFIYNWHLNMGFLSFVLSIPLFFFTLGYWWRVRERPTWLNQTIIGVLVFCVYLAHIITFAILLYTLLFLSLVTLRSVRRAALTFAVALPSLILFGLVLISQLSQHIGEGSPLVLHYLSPMGTLRSAIGRDMLFFVSFSPDWERAILGIAAGVVLSLLLGSLSSLRRNVFLGLLLALIVLYFALPAHIDIYLAHLSCRVLIFIALTGVVLLEVPRTRLSRFLALGAVVGLALLHIGGMVRSYQQINQILQSYSAAIASLPDDAHVLLRLDRSAARFGRIEPLAFFRGYYYMQPPERLAGRGFGFATMNSRFTMAGGGIVPPLGSFMGTLRSLQYRNLEEQKISLADMIGDSFAKKSVGDYVFIVVRKERSLVEDNAQLYHYSKILDIGFMLGFRRDQKVPVAASNPANLLSEPPEAQVENYSYLLLYQDPDSFEPAVREHFDPVFSQGYVNVLKRHDHP